MAIHDYLRQRFFPHMWCPGCGHGTVLNSLLRAVEQLGLSGALNYLVRGFALLAFLGIAFRNERSTLRPLSP